MLTLNLHAEVTISSSELRRIKGNVINWLDFENFSDFNWQDGGRTIKIARISKNEFIVALEVLPCDFVRTIDKKIKFNVMQVAIDEGPKVQTSYPNSLETISKGISDEKNYGSKLLDAKQHLEQKIYYKRSSRIYIHNEKWEFILHFIEQELLDDMDFFLKKNKYKHAIVIFQDFLTTDEFLRGLIITDDEYYYIDGSVHEANSTVYPYHVSLRVNSFNISPLSIDLTKIKGRELYKYLQHPIIWEFKYNREKVSYNRICPNYKAKRIEFRGN